MSKTFFCKGHLSDVPLYQLSPVYPFCQLCYNFMLDDGSAEYLIKTAKKYPENADWLAQNNGKELTPCLVTPAPAPVVAASPVARTKRGKESVKPRRHFATEEIRLIKDLSLTCREVAQILGNGIHFSTVSRIRKLEA